MTTIDAGNYTAKATRWAWDTAKDGGMCLALVFEITEGDAAGAQIDGRLYFDTDRADANNRTAADRSMEALRAMGLTGDIDTIDEDVGGLDQGDVEVVIKIKDNGYPEAKFINAPRGGATLKAFAPPPVDAKKAFFAQMKARAQAAGASSKASGTAPAQTTRAPAPQQRPAVQPTRGRDIGRPAPQTQAYDPTEDAGGNDDIPF